MPRSYLTFAALLTVLSCTAPLFAQGRLSAVRESVRTDDDDDSSTNRSSDDDDDWCDDEDDEFLSRAFGYALMAPYVVPHFLYEPKELGSVDFSRAPYADDYDGYLIVNRDDSDSDRTDWWAGRFRTEYGNDFNGVQRIGTRALLETSSRWGIDAEGNYWSEDLGFAHDHFWTGDANIIYRFAQNDSIQFRSGIGINWLADEIRGDVGFNFTYGIDLFPCKPWIIEHVIDAGKIGHAGLFHYRGSIGLIYDQAELFTGYDYFNIGGTNLQTYLTGLQLWF